MTELQGVSVLIADDENHIRILFRSIFMSMGAKVVGEAKNGEVAVEMFKTHQPDLLLLDVNMPLKDGKEALKDIMAAFPDAFVIMLTSVIDRETVDQCLAMGASNYILKDTPMAEIKEMIKDTWHEHKK